MAGVFGTPITEATLKAMPEYMGKEITQADMAKVARDRIISELKKENVTTYVENLKKDFGNGVCILAMFYNATGADLTHQYDFDWHGHIGKNPYPQTIKNGQWGGFLHVKYTAGTSGSAAVVLYRGKTPAQEDCAWLVSWSNPFIGSNSVYTEVRELSKYDVANWGDAIWDKMCKLGLSSSETGWHGCMSTVSCGDSPSPTLEATFTLTP